MSAARDARLARMKMLFAAGWSRRQVATETGIPIRSVYRAAEKLGVPLPLEGTASTLSRRGPRKRTKVDSRGISSQAAPSPAAVMAEVVDLRELVETFCSAYAAGGGDRDEARVVVQRLLEGPGSDDWVVERLRGGTLILLGESPAA